MKFPKGTKVEACAAKERGRYAMDSVQVEADKSLDKGARAICTDGRCLAVVPCELEPGDDAHGQLVPIDALKLARKVAGAKGVASVCVNGTASAAGQSFPMVDGEFPRYRAVLPDVSDASHVMVTLSADLIAQVLVAVASNGGEYKSRPVTFCVSKRDTHESPVVVVGLDAVGVIMPLTIERTGKSAEDLVRWARGGGK